STATNAVSSSRRVSRGSRGRYDALSALSMTSVFCGTTVSDTICVAASYRNTGDMRRQARPLPGASGKLLLRGDAEAITPFRVHGLQGSMGTESSNPLETLNPLNPLNLTATLALIIFGAGTVAGALGVALGLGGGIFLVPF